jgi:hypothetical protein
MAAGRQQIIHLKKAGANRGGDLSVSHTVRLFSLSVNSLSINVTYLPTKLNELMPAIH